MRTIPGLAAAALILPFISVFAFAEAQPAAPDDDTDWTVDVPTKTPTGGVTQPTTPEGGFSQPDRIIFGEKMREHVLDQICRNAQIPLGHKFSFPGYGSVGADVVRRLRVMPDNRVAIEDADKVTLDAGRTLVTKELGDANFGLWVGAHFDGTSLVIRPMPTTQSCDEIWRLLKVTDVKTIFPFKAERLSAMGVGELWKLPATLSIGHSESLSRAFAVAGSPITGSEVLSFGIGQTGAAMMTVYRLSEDKMRFRFRVSHARVHNAAGGIAAVYPAIHVIAAPANILMKFLDSELTRQISHYLVENIGVGWSSTDGQQLMMEFVLDPKNPEDMEELAHVLKGDFVELLKMAQRMVNLQASAARAQKDFKDVEAKQEKEFKRKANFPGLDIYHSTSKSLHLMLPFLFDHTRGSTMADDRIVRLDEQGGEVHIYRSDKSRNTGVIDLPVAGQYVKHNVAMSAQAFTFKDKEGQTSEPQAVYIQQEGFLRNSADDVRAMADDVNSIMAMTGAKGGDANKRLALPLDRMLPPEPPVIVKQAKGQEAKLSPTYHDGGIAFTFVFSQKAIAAIVNAANELIVRCYANTLVDKADRAALNWILDNGTMQERGKLTIDGQALKDKFNYDDNAVNWTNGLCQTAGQIIKDVESVRQAATPEARSEAIVKLLSGRGKSGIGYNDMMRVLVQLVDPLDVTADLVINVNKSIKGNPDLHAHMMLKKDRPDNPGLKAAGEAKNRFAQPSELVD